MQKLHQVQGIEAGPWNKRRGLQALKARPGRPKPAPPGEENRKGQRRLSPSLRRMRQAGGSKQENSRARRLTMRSRMGPCHLGKETLW